MIVNRMIADEYVAGASVSELAERWDIAPLQVLERLAITLGRGTTTPAKP